MTQQPPTLHRLAIRPILSILIFALPLAGECAGIEFDDRFLHPMYDAPKLTPPAYKIVFYDNMRPVWFAALLDDDPEMRRLAADTIAMAHRKGMRGLEEAETELIKLLQREDGNPRIRRSAASAIVEIDAQDTAALLAQHLPDSDFDYAQVVEPALARWSYKPMVKPWLARLDEPTTGRVRLLLAFQCLAVVREQAARDQLVAIALDPKAVTTVRLAAARAVSDIDRVNLIETSESLLSNGAAGDRASLLNRLVGTTLLRRHTSEPAIALLRRSFADPAPTVASLALRTLFEIDPSLVFQHAAQAIQHSDVNVRRVGAEALVARADKGAVELLAPLMDDPNRGLRRYVSVQLIKLAGTDELKPAVIAAASQVVAADGWRGIEQALAVLGALDHEPSANKMVELLHHKRPEVGFAAAWALQKIAVAEALPGMLQYASDNADEAIARPGLHNGIEVQLSQLFQAFGQQRYAEADSLLRKFIPKVSTVEEARGAAIWALGFLHEDKAPKDLAIQLEQRLADVNPLLPEFETVRRMSAISLARMRSMSSLPTLRKFSLEEPGAPPGLASVWAIEYLTDEEIPSLKPINVADSNWFLVPLKLAEPIERKEPSERANR